MIYYDHNDISPYKTGKRWDRLISPEDCNNVTIRNLNVGNVTYYKIVFFFTRKKGTTRFFLGIEGVGCYFFKKSFSFFHPRYVGQKLNLYIADANNIADWLNVQFGIEAPEYGCYYDDECLDRPQEM